jgi:hypothetical protein
VLPEIKAPERFRVSAEEGQGLLPFAERSTAPAGAKNPNVTREFKLSDDGPNFQEVTDPQTGSTGSFTVYEAAGEPARPIVFVNVNGDTIPFYRSSSGTSGKTAGSWYPVAGFDEGGWLVKGNVRANNPKANPLWSVDEGYNNPSIRKTMEYLNNRYPGTSSVDDTLKALERDFGPSAKREGVAAPRYKGNLPAALTPLENAESMVLVNRAALGRPIAPSTGGLTGFSKNNPIDLKRQIGDLMHGSLPPAGGRTTDELLGELLF